MEYFDLQNASENRRENKIMKRKKGRRVKEKPFKLWPVLLVIALIVLTFGAVSTATEASRFLKNDQITIEACTSRDDCEYDYRDSNLGFIAKLSIKLFYKLSDDVRFRTPGTYQVIYDSRLPLMKDHIHTIYVVDTTPPELSLNPMLDCTLERLDDFVDPGYYAVDICDGTDVAVSVDIVHSAPCWYTIIYTASDSAGNKAQQQRQINVVRGRVALTFDDGPSLNITPGILDVLAENDVKATFFVLGFGPEKEELILREFSEGHTIGYHGMSHDYKTVYSSLEGLIANFSTLEEKVFNLTGYTSRLIRFPGGSSNTVSISCCPGIMTAAVQEVAKYDYTYFDWNVDSGDAGSARNSEDIYQNVVNGIRAGRFNVVLMHDAAGKANTLEALQRIIDFCFENDYQLVSLDSTSPQVVHRIAN